MTRTSRKPKSFLHGTDSSYEYRGCDCTRCRDAHADRVRMERQRRAVRLAADPDSVRHGIRATYDIGCRCAPCKQARVDTYRSREAV